MSLLTFVDWVVDVVADVTADPKTKLFLSNEVLAAAVVTAHIWFTAGVDAFEAADPNTNEFVLAAVVVALLEDATLPSTEAIGLF